MRISILHKVFLGYQRKYSTCQDKQIWEIMKNSLDGYRDIWFMPLRLQDFMLGANFLHASLDVDQYFRDLCIEDFRDPQTVTNNDTHPRIVKPYLIPFKSLFHSGFDALQKKIDKSHIDSSLLSYATETLVSGFLYRKDYHESCLQAVLRLQNEGHISVIMSNHLFSRLTANFGRNHFVTNKKLSKWDLVTCPCSRNCGEEIVYDNIGIGSEYLWYGCPDIMMLPYGGVCGIVVPEDSSSEDNELSSNLETNLKTFVEYRDTSSLRGENTVERIISMAITFSMFQKISKPILNLEQTQSTSMVPIIAANARHFDIYLYDSKYDILLRNNGPPIPLWEDETIRKIPAKLNLSSVLQLWMTINYLSMQMQLRKEDTVILSGSCGFLSKLTKDKLEDIEATLQMAKWFYPPEKKEFELHFQTLSP
ncbi:uncharacterized protein LOC127724598 [Mytilus californianus]|uniref:uncharacterized protein LOC127724598 n=1 Tax=Mytilus californianus TaxID=6549 RepID=UPI002247D95B|nr:uncharacterized protein LOC127724598 [Mytilus californianus]